LGSRTNYSRELIAIKGMAINQYSAKDLIYTGRKSIGNKRINGWIWVKRKSNNDEGWLPLEILEEIK